ncbi:MAG: hypothetical protein GXP33_13045 [Spirochaetes bacterium]|nr:hypothetical protein [Spirochaetota bacterium]
MAGLLNTLKDLLGSLFNRDPKEIQKRKELKRIADFLKTIRPSYYKPGNARVLPGFASILYEFTMLLMPVYELLQKTIDNKDPKLSDLYRGYLIESRIPPEKRKKLKDFTYNSIRERVLNSISPESELKLIGHEFMNILKLFSAPEFNRIDIEYKQLEKLLSICKIDYEKILNRFDPKLRLLQLNYKPSFSPVPEEDVINEILDIYYVIWGLELSFGVENNLSLLLERLNKSNADELKYKINKTINRMQQLLNKHLAPTTLLFLIRAIKKDPFYAPEADKEMQHYLDKYITKLTERFQHSRDLIIRERRENAIEQDLKALFGEAELLTAEGYNEEYSGILNDEGFDSFKYIKPLMIVKSFVVAKFEKNMRENVNKIIIEGYFESESFQNRLSNLYYGCDKIMNEIIGFEEEFTGENKISVRTIQSYLKSYHSGKNVTSLLNRVVQSANSKAFSIIDDTTNLFYRLASTLLEIINDYKQNTPTFISNLKVIGGIKNREFIGNLVKDYNDLIKFVRIMKNFIIIDTTVKTAVKSSVD